MKKSLLDIEKEFREIAKSQNIVGDSVEAIIKLLAYNRYESLTSVDNTLLEFNPDTAVNMNSKLSHAADQMYSVNRGVNAKVKVLATVTGNVNVKKYEVVYSDKDNTLFFLSAKLNGEEILGDYNFMYGLTYELTLLKAEKIFSQEVTVDSHNKYLMEVLDNDISETYTLLGDGDEVSFTKDFGTHIDSSIVLEGVPYEPLAFDLTIPGYGLRMYAPDHLGFNTSSTYTVKYFKFLEDTIDSDSIQKLKIPGFKLDMTSLKIEQRIQRESTQNFLYNLRREMITQSRVRANEDIVNMFKKYFTSEIKDASMNAYDLIEDKITINYIPKLSNDLIQPFDPISTVDDIEMHLFKSKLMYYVTKNIVQKPIKDSSAIQLKMELEVVITELIDTQLILDIMNTYEFKLGKKLNKDEFIGAINDIPGVKYCSLYILHTNAIDPEDPFSIVEVEVDNMEAPIDSYFLLAPSFNYTYRR